VDPFQALYEGATSTAQVGVFCGRAAIHRTTGHNFIVVVLPFLPETPDKDMAVALEMVKGG